MYDLDTFDRYLVEIVDRLIMTGLSEMEAARLVTRLLQSILTTSEIDERIPGPASDQLS